MSSYYDYVPRPVLKTIIRRGRTLPYAGSRTLHFHAPSFGKSGLFFDPSAVPEFDGERAEVVYERVKGVVRILRINKILED